jgi:hypothetical protein
MQHYRMAQVLTNTGTLKKSKQPGLIIRQPETPTLFEWVTPVSILMYMEHLLQTVPIPYSFATLEVVTNASDSKTLDQAGLRCYPFMHLVRL